jgi:Acyl-CoA reductase (LuxC)
MKFHERAQATATSTKPFRWLGEITPQLLTNWVTRELGANFLDSSWTQYGDRLCRSVPCSPILHIVSGQTPHAALQSLIRGIMVGAENWIKLPATGLVEVTLFAASLPEELRPQLATRLSSEWLENAATVVVFGSDATIQDLAGRVRPWQRFIPHGHRISFGMILGEWAENEVSGAIQDGCAFDQLGCLSPQFFLVKERARDFAEQLAEQLREDLAQGELRLTDSHHAQLPVEAAAAIRTFREDWRFRTAGSSTARLWESEKDSLDWTVLFDPGNTIPSNPLYWTFVIKPMTEEIESSITPLQKHLSTIGIHPLNSESISLAVRLGAQRICALGQMQNPSLDWHHDGFPSLGSLVRVIDIETDSLDPVFSVMRISQHGK